MVVRTLYSMENEPDVTGACPFADVASGSYCEDAVTWAAANGIVSGRSHTRPAGCSAAPLLRSVRLSGQRVHCSQAATPFSKKENFFDSLSPPEGGLFFAHLQRICAGMHLPGWIFKYLN